MKPHTCLVCLSLLLCLSSCSKISKKEEAVLAKNKHAKGFVLEKMDGYQKLTVLNPYKNSEKKFVYLLVPSEAEVPKHSKDTQIIRTPVERIVLTSTTHVPILELINEENSLVGFPNTSLICASKTRERIAKKQVQNLGNAQTPNAELLMALAPDLIVSFAVDKPTPTLSKLQKHGIPILYNGDWLEETPLGRTEWMRLFGALYEKETKTNRIFRQIEEAYLKTKELARQSIAKPTVFSGSLFQNIWYLPAGKSFVAQLFEDAHTEYLWKDSKGNGSLGLHFENVLKKAKNADFWIGCDAYESKKQLLKASEHYRQFNAFETNHTYSYAHQKGDEGGLLYFELSTVKPDVLLKDIVKITHPELLPQHRPFFYRKLP